MERDRITETKRGGGNKRVPDIHLGKNGRLLGFSPHIRTGEIIKGTGRRGRRNSNQGRR